MNFTVLPDFLAIGGLVAAFWSLLKRTRQTRLRYWLVGWVLILIHIAAQFVSQNVSAVAEPATAISVVMLLLTSMAFIWAGNDMRRNVGSHDLPVTLLSSIPDALFYVALIYGVTQDAVYYVLTAAGLVSSLWVFCSGRRLGDRTERYIRGAILLLAYAVQAVLLYLDQGGMALNWSLFWHYLAAAVFFRMASEQATVGVRFTTLSFLAWAMVFPVSVMVGVLWPQAHVEQEVWNLPKFLVATGLIFTLLEEQMNKAEHAALHDALTDLPNRRLFLRHLLQTVRTCRERKARLAVLVIDLNGFKQVNDMHGHAVGDLLLQSIAQRLVACMRQRDLLARLGGDEFAVILADIPDRQAADRVAEKLHETLQQPITIESHDLQVSASIGVSVYPDDGDDVTALYAFADRNMYAHKHGATR
ncbi:GGDEF domain-containing protein [Oleiagrimonas soli]|uniref:Diguanylate cyclase (GGDEF)-like protein n=1 Tax=Oleiagrimonas soli TaxID=1543381 RepID=A0A841KLG7_9GAMM|nr:GGDEF domain-containing protein [Oleiagrimonas soli]MBB6184659.1 diguanylate cyclase (GGDEF)-like protein [Oleiagrimonas soli]